MYIAYTSLSLPLSLSIYLYIYIYIYIYSLLLLHHAHLVEVLGEVAGQRAQVAVLRSTN